MFQTNTIIKYMKIAVRNLFKIANEIISISNQPVMYVTMDTSNITQSNTQFNFIKIINTIQFYLVKFNIKRYKTTNHQLDYIISMTAYFI